MAKRVRPSVRKVARRLILPNKAVLRSLVSSARHAAWSEAASVGRTHPSAASVPTPPVVEGMSLFQAGVEALQLHRYEAAAEAFTALVARFPAERALLDRARVYLGVCERELRRTAAQPTTAEERLTAATAALNDGDDTRAEALVGGVLAEQPDQDLALYLSAAIHARRGRHDDALAQLRHAIALRPDVAAQATLDSDFDSLHGSAAFQALTAEAPARPPRRVKRSRS
jgi:tetratricopeptide (TPR) repeat protein